MSAQKLKEQLQRADLSLKEIERLTHRTSIVTQVGALIVSLGTLIVSSVGIYVARSQRSLHEAQALEAKEKQRVSFKFSIEPVLLPDGKSFYVRARLRNMAVRRLTVLMVGVRAWQGSKWHDNIKISEPGLLLSDVLVRECPPSICDSTQVNGKLRVRNWGDDITLEPTEGDSNLSLGPYPIDEGDLHRGFWLTGKAYVAETISGECKVDANPAKRAPSGAFPFLCEMVGGDTTCKQDPSCSFAEAAAEYHVNERMAKPMP